MVNAELKQHQHALLELKDSLQKMFHPAVIKWP